MNKRIIVCMVAVLVLTMGMSVIFAGCDGGTIAKDGFWAGVDTSDLAAIIAKVKENEEGGNYTIASDIYQNDALAMNETCYVDATKILIERTAGSQYMAELLTLIGDEDIKYARESKDAKWQYEKMAAGTVNTAIAMKNIDGYLEQLAAMNVMFDKKTKAMTLADKEDATLTANIECDKDGFSFTIYNEGKKELVVKIYAFGTTSIVMPEDGNIEMPKDDTNDNEQNDNVDETDFWAGVDKGNVQEVADKFLPAISKGNFAMTQYAVDGEESTDYNVTDNAVEAVTMKNGIVVRYDIYKKSEDGTKTIKYTKKADETTWLKVEDDASVYGNLSTNLTNLSPMLEAAMETAQFTLDATSNKFVNSDVNSIIMDIEVLEDGLLVHVNLANKPEAVALVAESTNPLEMYLKFTTIGKAEVEMPKTEDVQDSMWVGVDISVWKNVVDKIMLGYDTHNITADLYAPAVGEIFVQDVYKITPNGIYTYSYGDSESIISIENDKIMHYYKESGATKWFAQEMTRDPYRSEVLNIREHTFSSVEESLDLNWTYDKTKKRFTCHLPEGSSFTFEYADIVDDGVKIYFHDGDTLGVGYYHNAGSTIIDLPEQFDDNPESDLHGVWKGVKRSDLTAIQSKYRTNINSNDLRIKVTNSNNGDYELYTFAYNGFMEESVNNGKYHANLYCKCNNVLYQDKMYSRDSKEDKWFASTISSDEYRQVQNEIKSKFIDLLANIDVNAYEYNDAMRTHSKSGDGIVQITLKSDGIVIGEVAQDGTKTQYDVYDIYNGVFVEEPTENEIGNLHFNAWKNVDISKPNEVFPKFNEYVSKGNFQIKIHSAYGDYLREIDNNKISLSQNGVLLEFLELTSDNKTKKYTRADANTPWTITDEAASVFEERKKEMLDYGTKIMSRVDKVDPSENGEFYFNDETLMNYTICYDGAIVRTRSEELYFCSFGDVKLSTPIVA